MEKAINKALSYIDSFERKVMLCYLNLLRFFGVNRAKILDEKIENLTQGHQNLIDEYNLIMEKKSTLNKAKRDAVIAKVVFLIQKGHIKVNGNHMKCFSSN